MDLDKDDRVSKDELVNYAHSTAISISDEIVIQMFYDITKLRGITHK